MLLRINLVVWCGVCVEAMELWSTMGRNFVCVVLFPIFCLLVVLLFAAVTNGLPNGMARALICWSTCLLFIFRLNLLVANGRSE